MKRIQTTHQQEQRQYDEELDDITTKHHQHVFSNGIGYHTGRDLSRQLRSKSDDAQRQGPYQPTYQQEEKFLKSQQELHNNTLVFRLREFRETETDGKSQQQQRQDITFKEWLHDVIGDDADDMIRIGDIRSLGSSDSTTVKRCPYRKISRGYHNIKYGTDSSSGKGGQQGIDQCATEYPA